MFESGFFAGPADLTAGALTGLVFGFLLQKAWVTRADTILGQFLFRDFTVLKVMLTAVVVGGLGVYAMLQAGMIEGLQVKNATVWGNLVGGLIFGVGMALLGYCPGTGIAALGDGARDAIAGVLGMLAGAALYAEAHPWLTERLIKPLDLGKATLPSLTHLSEWIYLAGLAVIALAVFAVVERIERRRLAHAAAPAGAEPRGR